MSFGIICRNAAGVETFNTDDEFTLFYEDEIVRRYYDNSPASFPTLAGKQICIFVTTGDFYGDDNGGSGTAGYGKSVAIGYPGGIPTVSFSYVADPANPTPPYYQLFDCTVTVFSMGD